MVAVAQYFKRNICLTTFSVLFLHLWLDDFVLVEIQLFTVLVYVCHEHFVWSSSCSVVFFSCHFSARRNTPSAESLFEIHYVLLHTFLYVCNNTVLLQCLCHANVRRLRSFAV